MTKAKVLDFTAFHDWINVLQKSLQRQYDVKDHQFNKDPYFLRWIKIEAFNEFFIKGKPKPCILFMKIFAEVSTNYNNFLPGVVFLRGGSIAILMIRVQDAPLERYVIMAERPRVAAGSLEFMEIPAGMFDDEEKNVKIAGLGGIIEEFGLVPKVAELINMTSLAVRDAPVKEDLRDAMYMSPGGCDECIDIYLWEKAMDRLDIETLKGSLIFQEGSVNVRLLEYEKLVSVGARDGKTLAAWSLYEYLKRRHPEHLLQEN